MKTYTRKEIGYLLHLSDISIDRYCRGWYTARGHLFTFYPDGKKISPIGGEGTKGHPYVYDLKDFKRYILGLQKKKWVG